MTFANPEYFYLLLMVPIMIYWWWKKEKNRQVELQVSSVRVFRSLPRSWRVRSRNILFILRMTAIVLLIASLARPQSTSKGENVSTEGIDIVLVNDISGSMLAEDFRPNRIEAAKKTALEFIDGRPTDRIGLVVFAGESFTQCPLTLDHAILKNLLTEIRSGIIEDGTAIGMGLATAVGRLKESKAKSKVIVLLTDGINNRGSIDPLTSAGIAQEFGIRAYTVGVGTVGMAPYPVQTPFGTQYQNVPVEIDEKLLQQIADQTGGKYYRATDNKKLKAIYDEVDRLEKTKIEVIQFRRHKEEYYSMAIFAASLLLLELIFGQTIFRKIP